MSWARWTKAVEKDLARYVTLEGTQWVQLPGSFDLLHGAPTGRDAVVRTLYDELAGKQIDYAFEEYHWSDNEQRIRSPAEVLGYQRRGTCLDLAVLFAGLCLNYELLPLVIVLEGHALVAISRNFGPAQWKDLRRKERKYFKEGVLNNQEVLGSLVANGSYLPVECTGFARSRVLPSSQPEGRGRDMQGLLPFDRAKAAGEEQLHESDRPLYAALDIVTLHRRGVVPQPIRDEHQRALDDYVRAVRDFVDDFPYLALQKLRTITGDKTLDELYIPATLTYPSAEEAVPRPSEAMPGPSEVVQRPSREPVGLDELLRRRPECDQVARIVIRGGPGAGKSTLVRRLAKAALDAPHELGLDRPHLPMVVRLQWLAAAEQVGIESRLRNALDRAQEIVLQQALPEGFFEEWPRRWAAPWLLLLDGLDEVQQQHRSQFLSWLANFLESTRHAGHYIVITSRPSGLDDLAVGALTHLELELLTTEQRDDLARRLLEQRLSGFLAELGRVRLGELTKTPLLLMIAASVYAEHEELPERRVAMYEQFVSAWLREAQERGLANELGADLADAADQVLEAAALSLLARDQAPTIDTWSTTVAAFLEKSLNVPQLVAKKKAVRFLEVMARRSGVLTQHGMAIEWVHPTFGEYLAASRVVRTCPDPNGACAWDVVSRWDVARWQETIVFGLGLWSQQGKDVTQLLHRIMDCGEEGVFFVARILPQAVPINKELPKLVASNMQASLWRRDTITSVEVVARLQYLMELSLFDEDVVSDTRNWALWALCRPFMGPKMTQALASNLAALDVLYEGDYEAVLFLLSKRENADELSEEERRKVNEAAANAAPSVVSQVEAIVREMDTRWRKLASGLEGPS
jgi:NACHT domain